jgi:putative hemolysin
MRSEMGASAEGLVLDQQRAGTTRGDRSRLAARIASGNEEIRQALALRYQVFTREIGARIDAQDGLDCDDFDAYREQLIVVDEECGQVVGTYRILPPEQALHTGRYSAEAEFDLAELRRLRMPLVQIGRACVHPDYRTGSTLMMLWSALAQSMHSRGHDHVIGCASIGMTDGGANAAAVFAGLSAHAMTDLRRRVIPKNPLPLESIAPAAQAVVPPLLRGYRSLGPQIAGPPAWDPDFNTADLLVFLPMSRLPARYARRFLGRPLNG